MAAYTMRLNQVLAVLIFEHRKEIMETDPDFDFEGLIHPMEYRSVDEIIDRGWKYVWDFAFPIFDEGYREILGKKFLTQNWMREIGAESIGQWHLMLKNKMNLIMPYYNQMYESEKLKYDPLLNITHWETSEAVGTRDGMNDFTGNVKGSLHSTTSGTSDTTQNDNGGYGKSGESNDDGATTGKSVTHATGEENVSRETHGEHKDDGTSHTQGTDKTAGETHTETSGSESTTTSNTEWVYNNDTPQGGVEGLASRKYLTSAQERTGSGTSKLTQSGESSTTSSENVSRETSGETHGEGSEDGTEKSKKDTVSDSQTDTEGTSHNEGVWSEGGTDTHDMAQHVDTTGRRDDTTTQDTANLNVETVRTTDDYIRHYAGKIGTETYPEMVMKWRDSFLNIDAMVLRELDCLFMGLWQ